MKFVQNKFRGECHVCGTMMGAGEGWAVFEEKWKPVCNECSPLAIQYRMKHGTRVLTREGILVCDGDRDMSLIQAMPGKEWNPELLAWQVSLLPGDRIRVLEIAKKLSVEIKLASKKPRAIPGLYPFQSRGVQFLQSSGRNVLLADDMGLGKTVQALKALGDRGLVICPATLRRNWESECRRWRSDLEPIVLLSSSEFQLPDEGQLVILSYNGIPDYFTEEKDKKPVISDEIRKSLGETIVIFDEITLVKNYKSLRYKKGQTLRKLSQRSWGLSGSPYENHPMDLWGILSFLGLSWSVFGGWWKFLELFSGKENRWGGYDFGKADPQVHNLLKKVMLRRTKTEVWPEMPKIQYQEIRIDLAGNIWNILNGLWERHSERILAGVLPPFEEMSAVRSKLAEFKIPAATELVETYEQSETPVIVFSSYLAPVQAIGTRPGWRMITGGTHGDDRAEYIQEFQDGKLKGLALTIRTGGLGINLTHASHLLFVDLEWSPAINRQAIDRIVRFGQKSDRVLVQAIVGDHPLEVHLLWLLLQKERNIQMVMEGKCQ